VKIGITEKPETSDQRGKW